MHDNQNGKKSWRDQIQITSDPPQERRSSKFQTYAFRFIECWKTQGHVLILDGIFEFLLLLLFGKDASKSKLCTSVYLFIFGNISVGSQGKISLSSYT